MLCKMGGKETRRSRYEEEEEEEEKMKTEEMEESRGVHGQVKRDVFG